MSSQDLFKILKNDGWVLKSIVGSHHQFIHPRKDLAQGTVNSILKQAVLK